MIIVESCIRNAAELRMSAVRPFVTLSYTQSLDGCIAARPGEPFDIAGSESQQLLDTLRGRHDAVIVGIGTVLAGNSAVGKLPEIGVRPLPVILDSRLRLSPTSGMLNGDGHAPVIVTREGYDQGRAEALTDAGARVTAVGANARGQVSIRRALERLKEFGVNSVVVEGGSHILTSFLMSRLADFAVLTIVPVFVGGLRAVGDLNQSDPDCFMRIREPGRKWFGKDLIVWGPLA